MFQRNYKKKDIDIFFHFILAHCSNIVSIPRHVIHCPFYRPCDFEFAWNFVATMSIPTLSIPSPLLDQFSFRGNGYWIPFLHAHHVARSRGSRFLSHPLNGDLNVTAGFQATDPPSPSRFLSSKTLHYSTILKLSSIIELLPE